MTHVDIRHDDANWYVSIDGHAGYAPAGQDIVCAAVSMLTCTLSQWIEDSVLLARRRQESGDGWFEAEIVARDIPRVESAMSVFLTGFRLLAKQYPQHVKMAGEK